MEEVKIIQSVSKAIRLLDLLAESGTPMTLAQISKEIGWAKSSVHDLLSTMRQFSIVNQDGHGRYTLGIRLFEYSCNLSNSWTVLDKAKPYLQHISYATGEAVFLSVLDRGEVVTLDRAANRTGLWFSAEMGCRLPVHCTSQGKLFLAYMTTGEREQILQRTTFQQYTDATITSRDALQKELDLIRQRGYAMEISEYKPGMRSVAAPIFDEENRVRYAIGVIGTFEKSEADQFTKAVSVVVETAKKISEAI